VKWYELSQTIENGPAVGRHHPSIVTADEWDDEMAADDIDEDDAVAAGDLQLDGVTDEDDHTGNYFDEHELAEFERMSIEYEEQAVPSWAELFGFVGGFKCGTFQF